MKTALETDVAIIGAGITGVSIARELSQYKVDLIVVEKSLDTFTGQTKSSHGMAYSGRSLLMACSLIIKSVMAPGAPLWEPETIKLKLAIQGYELFEALAKRLDVTYCPARTLVIARNDEEIGMLQRLYEICTLMEIKKDIKWLSKEDVLDMEPNITREVRAGLYEENWSYSIFPPEYALANKENAEANGVNFIYGAEVNGIEPKSDRFVINTTSGEIRSKFIVNAAGLYADKVADMARARDDWGLIHNRTQMVLLDKRIGVRFRHANCIVAPPKPGFFEGIQLNVHESNSVSINEPFLPKNVALAVRKG